MSTVAEPLPESIWEMEVAESNGDGDFTPCPAGNYPGRIAGLFDIGHQPDTKTDKKTGAVSNIEVRKLVLVYELTKKQPSGQPYVMGDRLTWSMRDNSNFYTIVTNLTGNKFASGQKFNPTTLLGKPVMVSVVHKPGKENKTYANVGSVSQFPDGFPVPAFQYSPILWSVSEKKPFPAAAWLPMVFGKTIQALAAESAEARGMTPGGGAVNGAVSAAQAPAPAAGLASKVALPCPREVVAILPKYNLTWPYTDEDLGVRLAAIAPADLEVLTVHAIPY